MYLRKFPIFQLLYLCNTIQNTSNTFDIYIRHRTETKDGSLPKDLWMMYYDEISELGQTKPSKETIYVSDLNLNIAKEFIIIDEFDFAK